MSLTPRLKNSSRHMSPRNLGSLSDRIAFGIPQSTSCNLSKSTSGHSLAVNVVHPGINVILFENLSVTVSTMSCPSLEIGMPTMKSRVIV